jgi:hypothetical protein
VHFPQRTHVGGCKVVFSNALRDFRRETTNQWTRHATRGFTAILYFLNCETLSGLRAGRHWQFFLATVGPRLSSNCLLIDESATKHGVILISPTAMAHSIDDCRTESAAIGSVSGDPPVSEITEFSATLGQTRHAI